MQFVSDGAAKQAAIPRAWLIPPGEEKDEEASYVTSFHYDRGVSSFQIGNGRLGLHFSSYAVQEEGSAQAAAGRDVFMVFDPRSAQIYRGGIERGVTKQRVRSQGCFTASAERYFLADINGDGLTDIGVVKEELQCSEKADSDVTRIVGPIYKQHPIAWYVFQESAWKLDPTLSGKFPEGSEELPLIGIDRTPVDVVGCGFWRTCERTKWPTGETGENAR